MKRTIFFLIICSLFLLFSSCFTTKKAVEPEIEPVPEVTEEVAEEVLVIPPSLYESDDQWLASPVSDSVLKPVDVFFLFPPDFSSDAYVVIDGELDYLYDNVVEEEEEPPVVEVPAPVLDAEGNVILVDTVVVEEEPIVEVIEPVDPRNAKWPYYQAAQASVFTEECNLFAPLYTPVNPIAYVDADEEKRERLLREQSLPDITEAFTYYLENLNEGRPFILAGSSEGAATLLLLMKDLFDDEEIANRLIAAYLPGTSVTQRDLNDYPHLKFTERSDDSGVIISWNTEGEKITARNPFVFEDTLLINPTTWTYTEEFVSKTKNKGAIFYDADGNKIIEIRKFTSTQIDPLRRVVVAYNPDAGFYTIWQGQRVPRGIYHLQDFTFFYQNIRMNVKERIASYLDK